MTEFELAQLRRLPQRADDTWEGGWCRLPFRARIAGRSGAHFRLALWGSLETGEINRAPDPCPVEEATPERLFTAMVRFAIDKEAAGYRPGVVQVCDAALAEAWRGPLAGLGMEVELVPGQPEDLPALAPLLNAMRRDFGRDDGDLALASAPGVTIERLRSFADAAREFYQARPWERLDGDQDPICVVAPEPGPARAVVTVMGSMGQEFGLSCFASLEQFLGILRARDEDEIARALRTQERWSLTFVAREELPPADARAWRLHDLPAAGAYPLLLHRVPPGDMPPPEPADLVFFEALLRAIARATEDELDMGSWQVTVPTHDGPVEVELDLPELLKPPTWEDKLRRGWRPDSRGLELAHLIATGHLEDLSPAGDEEAEDDLDGNSGGLPMQDLVAGPRDDWERAQLLCSQAFLALGRHRLMLARRALAECPDYADAHVLLAERTADPERALQLYTAGVAAGPRRLDAGLLTELLGELWGNVHARPWLRALIGQAATLARLGRFAEARAACDELLRLDKGDPLGARKLRALLLKEERRTARPARNARGGTGGAGGAGGAGRGRAKGGGGGAKSGGAGGGAKSDGSSGAGRGAQGQTDGAKPRSRPGGAKKKGSSKKKDR